MNQRYGRICPHVVALGIAQMVIEKLPEITRNIAEQMSTIQGVNIYSTGGDNGAGIGTITGTLPIVLAQVNDTVKSAVGVDLASIVRKHGGPKDTPPTKEE